MFGSKLFIYTKKFFEGIIKHSSKNSFINGFFCHFNVFIFRYNMKFSLRTQGIQKSQIGKKQEDSSIENNTARQAQVHSVERSRFIPILVSKSTKIKPSIRSRDMKSQDISVRNTRDLSALSNTSSAKLTSVTSTQFISNPQNSNIFSSSNSVELLKQVKKKVLSSLKSASPQKSATKFAKKPGKFENLNTKESSRGKEGSKQKLENFRI